MRTFAKVEILGNVGSDPEMRFTPNGKAVTTFPIAHNKPSIDANGEKHEDTMWFDCVCWEKLAELVNTSIVKGDPVLISGALRMRTWKDKEGQMRSKLECQAREVVFLRPKNNARTEIDAEIDAEIDSALCFK